MRNQYLAAENRILRAKIKGQPQRSEREKRSLAEIAHRLGRRALAEVAVAAKPDTILCWFRKQVAGKFEWIGLAAIVGRPRVEKDDRGSDRTHGARESIVGLRSHGGELAKRGHNVSECRNPWARSGQPL